MLVTFQLMIVYTLFDPLSLGAQNLLMATGHPDVVMRIRLLQAGIFVPAVIGLSYVAGIEGVALAADIMIITGAVLLFWYTRKIITYSQQALWLWPLVALGVTAMVVVLLNSFWATLPLWGSFVAKFVLISVIYLSFLWLTERKQLLYGWQMIWGILGPKLRKA